MAPRFRPRTVLPFFLIVLAVGAAVVALVRAGASSGDLVASGTVEAEEIRLAPEIGGRVSEVLVTAGDPVRAGAPLLRLDDTLLQAQQVRLEAAVAAAGAAAQAADGQREIARLQLEIAGSAARGHDRLRQSIVWQLVADGDLDLPAWYWGDGERVAFAEAEVDAAAAAADEAHRRLRSLLAEPSNRSVFDAEQASARAQAAYLVADAVYRRAYAAREPRDLFEPAEQERQRAREELDRADQTLNDLLAEDRFASLRRARADLAAAAARLLEAQAQRDSLRTGVHSLEVQLAQAGFVQAEAVAAQAHAMEDQVRAELETLRVQLERTVLASPVDGVVLTRSADPGEVLAPAGTALTIGRLDDLTITVFLPEDRYGHVRLGEPVDIRVDSFPDEIFRGRVSRIADRAEFTPRNVQTEEGRRTTVFAIEVAIDDASGRLKPGMPADVTFRGEP